MIRIIQIILLGIFVIITSCENSTEPNNENEEYNIYEVVLRDKFHNYRADRYLYSDHNDSTYKVFFIGIYSEIDTLYKFREVPIDPNDDFLSRFSGFPKKIKKISNHKILPNGNIVDTLTNERGIIFKVGPIKQISDAEVEVEAGHWRSSTFADCFTFRLYKENGVWQIYYKTSRWILQNLTKGS